jgi:hypothetical protein
MEDSCGGGTGGDAELVEVGVRVRGRTESIKRLSKKALARGTAEFPAEETQQYQRPGKRVGCLEGPGAMRPCPWVSCKHHLYLDVNDRTGSIKHNFPDTEVWELPETCALDVADRGGTTLEDVGVHINVTRERVRQIEGKALRKLREAEKAEGAVSAADLYETLCDE